MEDINYREYLRVIKNVAVYLRKSRGDEDTDLDKHRLVLSSLCTKNGWTYVEYSEIGTSDSIDLRPKMKELLEDVAEDLYDAVVVIDIDRLSRGDEEDRGRYLNVFRASETYIVTPEKIYDLDDDNDDLHISVKGLLAREEYKSIKKRLQRGKKVGARQGKWTNGIPPFPYEYEKWQDKLNEKGLVINDDKLKIYRFMIDSYLNDDKSPANISWELNKQGIPSPRGYKWSNVTVYRMMVDETHLGKIITNKTKGDGHTIKKAHAKPLEIIPKSKWIVVENTHEPCKTQQEHEAILIKLADNRTSINREQMKIRPLTGLVVCAVCGRTMTVYDRQDRRTVQNIKSCWYKDPYGVICPNGGGAVTIVTDAIKFQLKDYEDKLREELDKDDEVDTAKISRKINEQLGAIKAKEKAMQRIYIAYEDEVYDLNTFRERKEAVEIQISNLTEGLHLMELELKNTESISNQDRIQYIEEFKELINQESLTGEEMNNLYKSIIDKIIWKRIGDDIEVTVNFM